MESGGDSGDSEANGNPSGESGFVFIGDGFKDSFTLTEGNEICSFSVEMNISQRNNNKQCGPFKNIVI